MRSIEEENKIERTSEKKDTFVDSEVGTKFELNGLKQLVVGMPKTIRREVNTELLALKSEILDTIRNKSYAGPSCNIELNSMREAKIEMQDFIKAEVHGQIEKMKLELLATIENSLNVDHRTSTPSKEGAKFTGPLPEDVVMQSTKRINSKRPYTAESGSSSFKEEEHNQEVIPKVSVPLPKDDVMLAIKKTNCKGPCTTKSGSSISSKGEHNQEVIPKLNDSNTSNEEKKPSRPKQKCITIKDNGDNEGDVSDNNDKKSDDNAEKTNLTCMYAQYVNSGGFKVGLFELSFIAPKEEFKLAMYIYDDRLSLSETLAKIGSVEVTRTFLQFLRPNAHVTGQLFDVYSSLLTYKIRHRSIPNQPAIWFLPSRVSQKGLGKGLNIVIFARQAKWRKYYIGDLRNCAKIIVPVYSRSTLHWFMAEVKVIEQSVLIWDSMSFASRPEDRESEVLDMLQTLDTILVIDIQLIFGGDWSFSKFKLTHASKVPQ